MTPQDTASIAGTADATAQTAVSATASVPIYLTTSQVAAQLQVKRSQVTKWVHGVRVAGVHIRLRADVLGDRFRITQAYIDAFLAECRAAKLGESHRPETPSQQNARAQREKQQLLAACGG